MKNAIIFVSLCLYISLSQASDVNEIINIRQYDDNFSSSGQPTAEQLAMVAASGTERIIYLAFTDNETAIEDEDRTVMDLGMEYVHIPVDFMKPTLADFQHFAAVMQSAPDKKTLLHCQINLRASAFSFLYRVIYKSVPLIEAAETLQGVWEPNQVWFDFMETVADHHELDLNCEDCSWVIGTNW